MRHGLRVSSVVGTRPEAIKMIPVFRALSRLPGICQTVHLTGQHSALEESFSFPGASARPGPALPEDKGVASLRRHFRRILGQRLLLERPDLLLVHGDTTSALAGALAASDCGIPIAHVEAGLRSHDLRQPWPEEGNRVAIDALSTLLFAPTQDAAGNLQVDHRVKGRIFVTGNTGIDALFDARERIGHVPRTLRRTILVTCHRKENQGERTSAICAALKQLARSLPIDIILPLHPNPAVRGPIIEALGAQPHIRLIEPVDHAAMVRLILGAWLILTDSGGLQEEGAALGRPVLVLRNVTERPEGLRTDNLRLIGTDTCTIVAAVSGLHAAPDLHRRMSVPSKIFGDGRASLRIAQVIADWLAGNEARIASRTLPAPAFFAKSAPHGTGLASRELEDV
jgi:UDP-N-acetylglucosamine 2-epimerase (non-hydrolysing)